MKKKKDLSTLTEEQRLKVLNRIAEDNIKELLMYNLKLKQWKKYYNEYIKMKDEYNYTNQELEDALLNASVYKLISEEDIIEFDTLRQVLSSSHKLEKKN